MAIRVNGKEYDHSSCRVYVGSTQRKGIKSISYGQGRDGEQYIYGTSRQPIARTKGMYKPKEVSATYYRSEWEEIRRALGAGFLDKVHDITIQRAEPGMPSVTDLIKGAQIKDDDHDSQEGGNAHEVKVVYTCMYVLEGGLAPIAGFER